MNVMPPFGSESPDRLSLSGTDYGFAEDIYLSLEDVQRQLRRSRASIYRYTNTDPQVLNPPYDASRLNPEVREHRESPLLFRLEEVRRFAQDVLGLNPTISVQPPPETQTNRLLREILQELRAIRHHLETSPPPP